MACNKIGNRHRPRGSHLTEIVHEEVVTKRNSAIPDNIAPSNEARTSWIWSHFIENIHPRDTLTIIIVVVTEGISISNTAGVVVEIGVEIPIEVIIVATIIPRCPGDRGLRH